MTTRSIFGAACLAALLAASPASAQSADNVLVVVNENSPASISIAGHYVAARKIPAQQVALLKTPVTENISYAEYVRTIESPLTEWIAARDLQDRILYIVLTKGVPIRILGTGGLEGTVSSVDSELTMLYRRMTGQLVPLPGREANPYYLGDAKIDTAKRFTRFNHDIYLVTRLDGYTVDEVYALIDHAVAPVRAGTIVLDQRRNLVDRGGDKWLADAAKRLQEQKAAPVLLEGTRDLAETKEPVLGYYSWGSNDESNRRRGAGLTFAPGALAGMFVSTDGRTFVEPPKDWVPGPSNRPPSMFGSGSQSMAADLIREGVTGVSAHVDEPYLDATVRPQILFPAYTAGFNLAEAYYLAMPFLSWRNMVIGDPLCAPFASAPLTAKEIAGGIDPATELPELFAQRRLAVLDKSGFKKEALQVFLKATVRIAKGDKEIAEKLLMEARDLEPSFQLARLQLGTLLEERENFDLAIEEYRKVLELDPRQVIALNNLAYALAVRKNLPDEGLPYAERAFNIAPTAAVADTLGWIHYLIGNPTVAAPLIAQAARAMPESVDVQLHAAFVLAAIDRTTPARQALLAALKLDPAVADRDDVKELKKKLDVK